ncbi:hypothetical protein ACJMK2_011019 [Sinanodonta woodiana]|uniref:FMP27/BLTP2/Hobbit GFWDK motif-containing RBG unit domain-containing protein n=1 Tax=Sinanodonta woodiana TaxID=1069815 RepID=A0ABD3V3W8_SINWO
MIFAIPSFCWTVLYLVVGIWLTMRILALVLQFLIKRGTGILVKIGSVGLGSFNNVHIGIRKGLHVEIDKLWLSSCFVNDSIRKPLVLCVGDIRIQADASSQQKENKRVDSTHTPPPNLPPKQFVLPKFAAYLQHFGLKINSLTVMLLKTMVPDCLIHVTGQELGLDISCPEDSFQMTVNVEGITCKALRSVPKDTSPGQASEPCLAEVSFSLYIDTSIYFSNIKQVKGLRILVSKPQMMLTEGLLTGIQKLQLNQSLDLRVTDSKQDPNTEEAKILELLPQELGIDFTEMDVKIVRETKQRSLSVGIKTFHVDLYNQRNDDNMQEVACTVLLEDFSTKSPQATFAELVKFEAKTMLYPDTLTVKSHLHGGFFHYHHEEVQYWVLVMSQLVMQNGKSAEVIFVPSTDILTVQPQQNTFQETKKNNKAVEFLREKQLVIETDFSEVSSSVSTASCAGLLLGVTRTKLHITVKPGINASEDQSVFKSHDMSCELEIDTLYCHHCDIKAPVSELSGKRHYWNHVIYMGILMLKVKKLGEELRLEGMEDHLHIEWSTNTVNALQQIMSAMTKTNQRRASEVQLKPVQQLNIQVPEKSSFSSSHLQLNFSLLHVKFVLSNANIFTCNDHKVGLMLRLDSASVDHHYCNTTATLEGCKIASITQDKQFMVIVRSADIQKPVLSIREVRLNYKQSNKEANIQVVKEVLCEWTTAHHMCVIQILQDLKQLTSKLVKDSLSTDPAPLTKSKPVRKEGSISLSVNLIVGTPISVTLHLSSQHRVTLRAASFLMTMSPTVVLFEIDKFDIDCDQHRIFTFEGILTGTLPDSELKMERKAFKTLELATNRAWNVSFDLVSIVFPYDYNFASCFEEFVNFTKWLKLVHSVQRKPFTVDSKLPPDLQIKAKVFKVELGDDPFEVKLADNYELMKDEYSENEKRKSVLDQKVQNLKKGYTSIPAHKLEELYASFAQRMSEIYMQRSRKLYSDGRPVSSILFTWQMEDLEIVAMADKSIHGKDNVVKAMRDIDPDSPYPEESLEFCTLWCRFVNVSLQSWRVQLRDYPQYMLDVKDLHVWGRLAAGEQEGAKRAKRTCTVEVAEPWGPMTVERNLPALKFYHDFSSDVQSWEMAYGACWEPVVAQYNLSLDLVNKPSIDPSRPMPWWDKIRLLLHGRLTLSAEKMSWLYHASLDPYNTTELMDWSWSNLIMDWTNGKFILKGDLDIYARTASKYDDCRLLYLPGLTMTAKLEWLCLGDPNDHHTVMPCAPDKVPDYSHEEHDSFRAFRSQNMNLHLSLKTCPPRTADPTEFDQPSCLFYASTIRFLDKIKLCMMGVTRPTRRGALFENTKIRKPQLSRHYKLASLSVNFHQFDVCYWMSFSKQHGAEMWGKSFVLELCNELRLVPIEDGLFRRPKAEWSIKNLTCDLSALKFLLCSSKLSHEEELNVSSTGKPVSSNFCLSVSRVSYRRANPSTEANKGEKSEIPTHQVQVYELRGMWTKQNRTILLGLYDSYTKAQSLKRNLSSEALRGFKMEGGASSGRPRGSTIDPSTLESQTTDTPSPLSRLQTSHAYSMLMKLVAESDSKSVAFTEEPSQSNMDQLHGVAACQTDDVLQKNWLIELHNSQIIVKGCETPGYLIVGAGKSQVLSCTHNPVWVRNQIRGKGSWVGSIECMQYYATVDPNCDFDDDDIPWLSRDNVESRPEPSLSGIKEMVGSGHSVGGMIETSVVSEGQVHINNQSSFQLQRIISRCKCQFFYADYSEIDTANLTEVPPPPSDDSDMMQREEGVDVFTLLHHDLNICSNSPQYEMILDIVNNLLLYVEPKKKEATEKLQNMRFKLQLSRVEDQKTPILNLQESLRQQIQRLRYLERELYQISRALEEVSVNNSNSNFSTELMNEKDMVESKLKECKEKINSLNEELGIRISCFKENQLQLKSQLKMTQKAQQAQVVRRNEVCFKFAQWRLNEPDGQIGLADLALRNFVYTKVNRDDDTWTHQLELGWVKVTNLLPNSYYKEVLGIRDNLFGGENDSRRVALRILCSEKAPVGGIAIKEHVEVNVVPVNIQITYQFYKTMMNFFFPGKNIENEEAEEETDGAAIKGTQKKLEKKNSAKEKKESVKRTASANTLDDIDKMKGEKEKNLEDVHEFNLVLPTIEYHNSIWTWFDLLMAMKNDSKRVLISQAIKQKLHMRSRAGEEGIVTDVQQEEDKAKMLLGAKLLAGQEKPAKKTLFGKSQK